MRLGVELKAEIIYHFRRLQRCRKWEEWEQTEELFFRRVQRAIVTQGQRAAGDVPIPPATQEDTARWQAQYDFVYRYFKQNWFTEEWIREHPSHMTR